MAEYKHILCTTDLSTRAPLIGAHALDVAKCNGARISFMHVIQERDWGARAEIEKLPHESDEPVLAQAGAQLAALTVELGVPDAGQYVMLAG